MIATFAEDQHVDVQPDRSGFGGAYAAFDDIAQAYAAVPYYE
jgi:hypothetical protein